MKQPVQSYIIFIVKEKRPADVLFNAVISPGRPKQVARMGFAVRQRSFECPEHIRLYRTECTGQF